jgi:hypothetical protein
MSAEPVVLMHHAGGWPELVVFGGPVAIIALLILVARKPRPEDDEQE